MLVFHFSCDACLREVVLHPFKTFSNVSWISLTFSTRRWPSLLNGLTPADPLIYKAYHFCHDALGRWRRWKLYEDTIETIDPGEIVTGTVDHVGADFAELSSGNVRAIVFLSEMANHRISRPSEVLSKGQEVEFVLLRPNEYKSDEWIASIVAVSEARARQKLSGIERDHEIHGTVYEINENGVVLKCDGFNAWIPLSEMAWRNGIEHPSAVVRMGEEVKVKVLSVKLPDGWSLDKKKRWAGAVVSRRACLSKSPIVEMPFSCLAFKVWVVPKKPRNCDPVVLHVLKELVRGCGEDEIRKSTGLPARTLDEILDLLEDEGLAQARMPSTWGIELAEAISRAGDLNADPIRGLFASAAPLSERYRRRLESNHSQREYPNSWARPPFNRPAETKFFNSLTNKELHKILIEHIASDDQRDAWAPLLQDTRLRVCLRLDGSPKIEYVPVHENWVFAGLWSEFDAVGTKPYRPPSDNLKERCRDFLMIRLIVKVAGEQETKFLYFEPWTETCWVPRSDDRPRVRELNGKVPATPNIKGITLPQSGKIKSVTPDRWCKVEM